MNVPTVVARPCCFMICVSVPGKEIYAAGGAGDEEGVRVTREVENYCTLLLRDPPQHRGSLFRRGPGHNSAS